MSADTAATRPHADVTAVGATAHLYAVEQGENHEPTQKPTTPAYRAYLEAQQSAGGRKVVLDSTWASAADPAVSSGAAGSTGSA